MRKAKLKDKKEIIYLRNPRFGFLSNVKIKKKKNRKLSARPLRCILWFISSFVISFYWVVTDLKNKRLQLLHIGQYSCYIKSDCYIFAGFIVSHILGNNKLKTFSLSWHQNRAPITIIPKRRIHSPFQDLPPKKEWCLGIES